MALALFTRRPKQDTTDATTPQALNATETQPVDNTVMRFRTQGGATVRLYRHNWTATYYRDGKAADTLHHRGFEWTCDDCDTTGAEKYLRLAGHGYEEHQPRESRRDANDHARTCQSMDKTTA